MSKIKIERLNFLSPFFRHRIHMIWRLCRGRPERQIFVLLFHDCRCLFFSVTFSNEIQKWRKIHWTLAPGLRFWPKQTFLTRLLLIISLNLSLNFFKNLAFLFWKAVLWTSHEQPWHWDSDKADPLRTGNFFLLMLLIRNLALTRECYSFSVSQKSNFAKIQICWRVAWVFMCSTLSDDKI